MINIIPTVYYKQIKSFFFYRGVHTDQKSLFVVSNDLQGGGILFPLRRDCTYVIELFLQIDLGYCGYFHVFIVNKTMADELLSYDSRWKYTPLKFF